MTVDESPAQWCGRPELTALLFLLSQILPKRPHSGTSGHLLPLPEPVGSAWDGQPVVHHKFREQIVGSPNCLLCSSPARGPRGRGRGPGQHLLGTGRGQEAGSRL